MLVGLTASTYNDLGLQAIMNQNPEAAMWYFDRALELEPGYADAAYNRGRVYEILGDCTQAADYSCTIESVFINH